MKEYIKLICTILLFLLTGSAFPVQVEVVQELMNPDQVELPAYRLRNPDAEQMKAYREDVAFNYSRQESEMPEWVQRCIDWLVEHLFGMEPKHSPEVSIFPEWWEILLRIGAIAILVFFVYKLVRSKYNLPFGPKEKRFSAELVQEVPESVDKNSYVAWLERAISSKDFPLAVRIHYLYILFLLDRNGIIVYDKRKTNVTYLYEIKDMRIKSVFKELSWIFDCVCYGEFSIEELAFQQIEDKFKTFQKEIGE